jgi:hypothetical protein
VFRLGLFRYASMLEKAQKKQGPAIFSMAGPVRAGVVF